MVANDSSFAKSGNSAWPKDADRMSFYVTDTRFYDTNLSLIKYEIHLIEVLHFG